MNQKFKVEMILKDGDFRFVVVEELHREFEFVVYGNVGGTMMKAVKLDNIVTLVVDGEYVIDNREEELDRYVFKEEHNVHTGIFYLSAIDENQSFPYVLVANKDDIGLGFNELDEKYGTNTRDFDVARLDQIEIYKGE